jgi:hypothetical protein
MEGSDGRLYFAFEKLCGDTVRQDGHKPPAYMAAENPDDFIYSKDGSGYVKIGGIKSETLLLPIEVTGKRPEEIAVLFRLARVAALLGDASKGVLTNYGDVRDSIIWFSDRRGPMYELLKESEPALLAAVERFARGEERDFGVIVGEPATWGKVVGRANERRRQMLREQALIFARSNAATLQSDHRVLFAEQNSRIGSMGRLAAR